MESRSGIVVPVAYPGEVSVGADSGKNAAGVDKFAPPSDPNIVRPDSVVRFSCCFKVSITPSAFGMSIKLFSGTVVTSGVAAVDDGSTVMAALSNGSEPVRFNSCSGLTVAARSSEADVL